MNYKLLFLKEGHAPPLNQDRVGGAGPKFHNEDVG